MAGALHREYAEAMSSDFHQITNLALGLPPEDRLALATELIDSVEGPADPGWDEAWLAELQRRTAAADEREARGEPRGIPWSEARARLLRQLAER